MTAPKVKARRRSRVNISEHLITKVRPSACKHCGRALFVGHVMGEPTQIDATRINAKGELVALLRGNKTYHANSHGGRVFRRRAWHITHESPPRFGYVHAQHDCAMVWPAECFDLRELWPTYRGDACPF